jgi:hypothetical protein
VTPLASRCRRAEREREHAAIVARALLDTGGASIPAVGRGGVGGAIPGTRPDQAINKLDRR